jgi:hypothetical protein
MPSVSLRTVIRQPEAKLTNLPLLCRTPPTFMLLD